MTGMMLWVDLVLWLVVAGAICGTLILLVYDHARGKHE